MEMVMLGLTFRVEVVARYQPLLCLVVAVVCVDVDAT